MASFMLLLVAVALSGMMGLMIFVQVAAGVAVIGFITSWSFDRKESITYVVEDGQLYFKAKRSMDHIAIDHIQDASLVDRRAARDLLVQRLRSLEESGTPKVERARMRKSFTRWCTVDVGMSTFTFGIGRDMIDRRPDGKQDLVVIRLRDGSMLVLSPVYNQDMVETLNRLIHQTPKHRHRA